MKHTIAVTELVEGEVLIGETITISTIMPDQPRRQTYRGVVYDIRQWPDGCWYAHMVVLARDEPITIMLETPP